MHRHETNNKAHLAAASALALMLGASVIACSGGGGDPAVAPPPVPTTPSPEPAVNGPAWLSYGGDAQHSAIAGVRTQDLAAIAWQSPVDVAPQYSAQGYLLVHYGSPVITAKNTVIVPVKRSLANAFKVEARVKAAGSPTSILIWSVDSDYVVPAHNWTPPYDVTLTKANRVVMPGAGGKVFYRDDADSAASATNNFVFYGKALYTANQAAFDAGVFINTPITADNQGNLFFGYVTTGSNPAGVVSGFARIGADGTGSWVPATTAANDPLMTRPAMGAAPAMSPDQKTVYVAVKGSGIEGRLLALDSTTLALNTAASLTDPVTNVPARVSEDSTASPMVGPDGDVYYGVLESVQGQHNSRGWLLHFDATLAQRKTIGSFGWDDTPSVVPAALVPGYGGSSSYLLMTKYNMANLFITTDGRVKILDFGLATLRSQAFGGNAGSEDPTELVTMPGTVMGTVGYMSPEQVRGMEANHRSDIFVLGVILYEMFSGTHPFQGASATEVLHGILKAEPVELSEKNPTIPPALSRLVHRCLEKAPERRFQSASDLSFALETLALPSSPVRNDVQVGTATSRPGIFRRNIALLTVAAAIAIATLWFSRVVDDPWQMLQTMSFKPLTNTEGDEWGAEISLDGQLVAFLDRDGPFDPWDVWITQFGGGPFNNLTKGVAPDLGNPRIRNLRFSHDGRQIVMEVKKDGKIDLWSVSTLGGSLRKFREEANEIAFSHDGSRMVYHDDPPGDPMFVTNSEGVGTQIHVAANGVHCHFQAWSPDDAFIYFVQGFPPDRMDIWRIRSSPGGVPEQVTFHNSLVAYPTFVNDRMLLYIARNPDGSGPSLYGVDVRQRTSRRITFGVEQYTSIASSTAGNRLVATVANPLSNLWRMPISNRVAEESDASRVPLSTVQGLSPRWTPDGLIYLSSRSGDNGIWKFTNGTSTEVHDGSEGRVLSAAIDAGGGSSRIAAVVEKNGRTKLYIMNRDGTGIQPLGDSLEVRGAPSWSPDGQWITIAVDEGAGPRIFKFSPDDRSQVRMATEYSVNPVWSPDGRFLVYAGPQVGTTFRLHAMTRDGQPHPMPEMNLDLGALRFSFVPGTSSLVFLKGGLWNKNLWIKELQTGAERQLTNFSREVLITDFDVSLDGREIILSRQMDNSNVVLVGLRQN